MAKVPTRSICRSFSRNGTSIALALAGVLKKNRMEKMETPPTGRLM
jgi:hypothetical protein